MCVCVVMTMCSADVVDGGIAQSVAVSVLVFHSVCGVVMSVGVTTGYTTKCVYCSWWCYYRDCVVVGWGR